MADIKVIIRKERAYLIPESELGGKWLDTNITGDNQYYVSIQKDLLEDMIKEMKEAELSIEY